MRLLNETFSVILKHREFAFAGIFAERLKILLHKSTNSSNFYDLFFGPCESAMKKIDKLESHILRRLIPAGILNIQLGRAENVLEY